MEKILGQPLQSLGSHRYEEELASRQSVENDIHGLRKLIDDTNITRLQLETKIETLKEELLIMKKNHEEASRTPASPGKECNDLLGGDTEGGLPAA